MLEPKSQQIVDAILAADEMTEGDLLRLRRALGSDFVIDQSEAETIFQLNAVSSLPESWTSYFTSVFAAYVDDAGAQDGMIAEEHAIWLIEQIDHDGVVETETELALLLGVLRTATHVPDILTSYALTQIYTAVMTGTGRVGKNMLTPGAVGEAEVALLRTVIYSGAGAGGLRISRSEAELILALNDATQGRDNHSSWQRLYVQALANHLMLAKTRSAASAADAARLAAAPAHRSLGERLNLLKSFRSWKTEEAFVDELVGNGVLGLLDDRVNDEAQRVVASEASWLIERILADGEKDENERALLRFIRDECPDIDPALQPLIAAA